MSAPSPANRAEDILGAVLDLESSTREAFIIGACTGNPVLLAEVRALLAAHEAMPTGFLAEPAVERIAAGEIDLTIRSVPVATPPLHAAERAGEMIGHYKLLQQIGEGGFGTVWMAEQEKPVRRRVALKIIKMGMDTKEVIARFEQERQALAMMEHPNIARVFDAGATQFGRPFFVMELVRGVKITEYCDEQGLSTAERIELFIHVCQAVQHAHQKGIIHRDLKPSNILVTINDGKAVPKVIDFGVAKATQGRLTDGTLFTQFEQMIGTPLYMSPEQAEMTSLDIDTRSDIYSLGVLLYELLTGHTPIDQDTLARLGMDEIRRIIREVDPPRPSARVKNFDGAELTTAAKRRHMDAAKLPGALRGDLDWIVMKCIEKDRKRRYDTANGLASDLQRHLKNEVVTARPPSSAYRFQKLVRRNRLAFAATGAVAMAVVLGFGFSSWQAIRATRSERNERSARVAAEESRNRESEQRALADGNARKAVESEQSAHRLLYAADMGLAHQAWEEGNLSRVDSLLEAHRPQPGAADLRGFEFFHLQNLAKGEQEHVLHRHTDAVSGVAISPDGKWLALRMGNLADLVQLWDLAARKQVASWPASLAAAAGGRSVSFSYDSQYLAVEAEEGLQLCDVTSLRSRLISTGQAWQATFSPVTHWIAYDDSPASPIEPSRSRVWDYLAGKEVNAFAASGILGWSPDGARLLTGRIPNGLEFWNVATGRSELSTGIGANIMGTAVSATGLVATADWQGTVHLVEKTGGTKIGTIASGDVRPAAVAFSPDGKFLATGSANQAIQIWDVATRQLLRKLRGHRGKITGLAFTPDGRTLASTAMDGAVMLWNPMGQPGESQIANDLYSFGRNPPQFSPDGKWLALQKSEMEAVILDASSLQAFASVTGELVSFSPDSRQLVTWIRFRDNELRVWTVGATSHRATIHLDKSGLMSICPQLSPDGTVFALSEMEGEKSGFFKAATGETVDDVLPSAFPPNFTATSPDGKILAAPDGDNLISLVDTESGARVGTLAGHQAYVFGLAFSPDGRTLVSGSEDRTIKLWHLATQRELASFLQEKAVYWLAFSPDSQLLVSGGIGSYQIWRAPRGDVAVTLVAPQRASADLPSDSIWRLPDGGDRASPRTVAEQEVCFTHLVKIHGAIMAYRKEHGQMPDGFGDLVPAYLNDSNCWICPVQTRTGIKPDLAGMEDPKVASSYLYEFNGQPNIFPDPYGVASPGDTMKTWKEKQLLRYGSIVPVVRCWMHSRPLGVTLAGERHRDTGEAWEVAAEETLRQGKVEEKDAKPIPR